MKPIATPVDVVPIEVVVNGETEHRLVPARHLLVDLLRDGLDLTATHVGCEHGICGACTVLIDGLPARSCITLAVSVDGAEVTTLEGLADDEDMVAMQHAFASKHGLQCGFCTPGFLMSLAGAGRRPGLSDDEVREVISGNLCRCTGYQHIVEAVQSAWNRPEEPAPAGATPNG